MRTFVDDLDQWEDLFPTEDLDRALRNLWAFIEKTGTGGALFRRLQASFLLDLHVLLPEPRVAIARECYADLADEWTAVAAAARAEASPHERLADVRRLARDLPDLEEEAADRLSRLAAALG